MEPNPPHPESSAMGSDHLRNDLLAALTRQASEPDARATQTDINPALVHLLAWQRSQALGQGFPSPGPAAALAPLGFLGNPFVPLPFPGMPVTPMAPMVWSQSRNQLKLAAGGAPQVHTSPSPLLQALQLPPEGAPAGLVPVASPDTAPVAAKPLATPSLALPGRRATTRSKLWRS